MTQLWPIRCKHSLWVTSKKVLISCYRGPPPPGCFHVSSSYLEIEKPSHDQRQIRFPLWTWSLSATLLKKGAGFFFHNLRETDTSQKQLSNESLSTSVAFIHFIKFAWSQKAAELVASFPCCLLFTWQGDTAYWEKPACWKLGDLFCVGHVYGPVFSTIPLRPLKGTCDSVADLEKIFNSPKKPVFFNVLGCS